MKGPVILGSGPLADGMRAELARDPERYRPETWSISPAGHCPCCDQDVFRCTTRHTGWVEGFASHANVIHPRVGDDGYPAPDGPHAGCCCVEPNWGPKHAKTAPVRKPRRKR